MKTIRLGEATRNSTHRQAFVLAFVAAVALWFGSLTANATTYYSAYGQTRNTSLTVLAGTHTFEVNGIASYKYTEWYVNTGAGYVYKETDNSGLLAIDPDYSYAFASGTIPIKAIVYNSDWTVRESHIWNVTVDITPPSVPSLSSPANGSVTSDNTVSLDWSDSSDSGTGVANYEVQVDDSSGFGSPNQSGTPTSSSATTSTLADGLYYWRVRAKDNAGNWSSYSSSRTFRVDTTAPSTPSLNSPGNNSSTSDQTPTFDWADSTDTGGSGVSYYEVEIYDGDITWGDISTTTTSSTYTPPSNIPLDTIYWQIRAVDSAGNKSAWSAEWSVNLADNTAPTVPSLSSPSDGSATADNTVSLDWSDSSDSGTGVANYEVQVDDSSSFTSLNYTGTPSSSSATTSALGGGLYYWRVRAKDNADNWSSYSSSRTFRVDTTAPSTPSLSSPSNGSSTGDQTPTFDWSDSTESGSGLYRYEIEVYDGDITWGDISATPTASTFTPGSNIPFDRIYWKVRAVDNVGNASGWSTEFWFDLVNHAPTQPGNITPSSVTSDSAGIAWIASTDSDGDAITYEVEYGVNNTLGWTSAGTTTSTSRSLTGLQPQTTYVVRVRATDGRGGVSSWRELDPAFTTLPVLGIASAYWLAPNYVTEGTVGTMRAQVSGYSVGDQFAFEIREDDGILGYDSVTTEYGNVYSSGGNLYVDATWTTAWQSDQSGDPEFYFIVSRGGTSLQSSTADADEMHVASVPSDTTPDGFTFTDVTGAEVNTTYTSGQIAVSGINAAAAISIVGGSYSVNGGAYTSTAGTVNNGNTVAVRQTSSGNYSTKTSATLSIGGVSDSYDVTTKATPSDTTPDGFTFTDVTGAAVNTTYTSSQIIVNGINAATAISIAGGSYNVNGGAYTSTAGTVNNGNTVRVRQTSSPNYQTSTSATLTIGGVSDSYDVTTKTAPSEVPFYLTRFPLDGVDQNSPIINSVFDHFNQRQFDSNGKVKPDGHIYIYSGEHADGTPVAGGNYPSIEPLAFAGRNPNFPGGNLVSYENHNGIDYHGNVGDPIFAAHKGTVVEANSDENRDGGRYVWIQSHDGKYQTRYFHLYSVSVAKYDDVVETTQIGVLGNSGTFNGNVRNPEEPPWNEKHLHFGLHKLIDGTWIPLDPYGWDNTAGLEDPYAWGRKKDNHPDGGYWSLANQHSVVGEVSDASGRPVAGVEVNLEITASLHAVTSETGEYRFSGIANGATYTVSVTAPIGSTASSPQTFTAASEDSVAMFSLSSPVVPPSVTQQPQPITVTVGEPVSFFVQAAGSGPFAYQWRKGGASITGETNAELSIADVVAADNGSSFDAVVSNPGGSVTTIAAVLSVNVIIPPVVKQLTEMVLSNGAFSFVLNGPVGSTYLIQVSSNLANWLPLWTNVIPPSGWVRISNPITSNQSQQYYRAVPSDAVTIVTNMALIPASSFQMGDSLDSESVALPVHTVNVSAFYMDKYEVSRAVWNDVYQWAMSHGYDFENVGAGAWSNPVVAVNWYDVVKWCNARSEKEDRTPAYYTGAAHATVYRTGRADVGNDWVIWNAGYRLPTEGEWEKAARGGASGHRFPWADEDTITHSQANYYSSSSFPYDISPTRGFHPDFSNTTSPVGYFAPNGYGLFDMAGNVHEWCWDRHFGYSSDPQTDPHEATVPSLYSVNRVLRGGSWLDSAAFCRSSSRYNSNPDSPNGTVGFRSVVPVAQ